MYTIHTRLELFVDGEKKKKEMKENKEWWYEGTHFFINEMNTDYEPQKHNDPSKLYI